MQFELVAAVEPCLAFQTLKQFEIHVPSFVVFSIPIGYELLTTKFALKWFFTSMDPQMVNQTGLMPENLLAASVGALVSLHVLSFLVLVYLSIGINILYFVDRKIAICV